MIGIPLEQWRCEGRRADGERCNHRIADGFLVPGSIVSIRCRYCKFLNVRETATYMQSTSDVNSSMLMASRGG